MFVDEGTNAITYCCETYAVSFALFLCTFETSCTNVAGTRCRKLDSSRDINQGVEYASWQLLNSSVGYDRV